MANLIVILHIIVCIFLIGVVLLQAGKGASIGATFGGASQTVFGSRGPANFLTRLTIAAALIFMLTSVFLAYDRGTAARKSIFKDSPAVEQTGTALDEQEAPAEDKTN